MTNKRKQVSKHKDIARIDQELKCTHGWYVRIKFQGKILNKFFSDKKNGGKDSSLELAITWRDHTRAKIGKSQSDRQIVTVTKNATRVVGVYLEKKQDRYIVTWANPNGRQNKTSVSIKKHGEAAALKLAIQKREKENQKRLSCNLREKAGNNHCNPAFLIIPHDLYNL